MAETFVGYFVRCLSAALGWFVDLLMAAEAGGLFLSAVYISLIWRFLLSPLFSSAGSDKARKKDDE